MRPSSPALLPEREECRVREPGGKPNLFRDFTYAYGMYAARLYIPFALRFHPASQ